MFCFQIKVLCESSDLLLDFHLMSWSALISSILCCLAYCILKASLLLLCVSDETEDEDVHKEYVEETNRDAIMIAAAKLIASDVVPKVIFYFLFDKVYEVITLLSGGRKFVENHLLGRILIIFWLTVFYLSDWKLLSSHSISSKS